mgnify:CR=1 FL=1
MRKTSDEKLILSYMRSHSALSGKPIVVFANKQDAPGAKSAEEVADESAAALGRGPQLEAFFCERVLDAFVRATYTRGRLDGVERGSRSGLPTMYRATLEFVEERCGAALRACEVAARGVDDARDAELGRLFERIDTDKSGDIDQAELLDAIKKRLNAKLEDAFKRNAHMLNKRVTGYGNQGLARDPLRERYRALAVELL